MKPQAVIYDIGNVLIEWNPGRFYDARIGPDARKRMFAEADPHAMNELIDAGGLFRETIYDWAARHPAWETELRWWHDPRASNGPSPCCGPCGPRACRCSRCRISASIPLPMR
jgi:hypothetical protein